MRRSLVAGNWKMNMTVEEARNFVADLGRPLDDIAGVEKVLCPPFTALMVVHAMLEGLDIGLGAIHRTASSDLQVLKLIGRGPRGQGQLKGEVLVFAL